MRKLFLVALFVSSFFSAQESSQKVLGSNREGYFLGSLHVGQSFRTAEVTNTGVKDVDNLQEKLLTGRSLDLSLRYFMKSKRLTLGFKYNNFYTNDTSGIVSGITGINFYAGTIGFFVPSRSNIGMFNVELGLGYLDYQTDMRINGITVNGTFYNPYKVVEKGNTFGLSVSAGYDFKITDNIYIGPHLEIIGGTISEIELNDNGKITKMSLEKDQKISLTRVDLNAHLSIIF